MMTLRQTISAGMARAASAFHRLRADARGVAAIEFAFIAPLLLSLYLVTMEVGQGIETNKKVGRVGSMVADLITRQQAMNRSELDAIMEIGASILQPYSRTKPRIVVTAIQVTDDDDPEVEVVWSRKLDNGVYTPDAAPGTPTSVPDRLETPDTFLIRVESYLDYEPVITWTASQKSTLGLAAAFDGIAMGERYYLRPRMSHTIPCDDC